MERTRLLLIEDNRLLREALVAILHALPDMDVVAALGNEEGLALKLRECKPHVVLLDPGRRDKDSFRVIGSIKQQFPGVKVIVIDLVPPAVHIVELVRAGASGFILRDASLDDCVRTIRAAIHGADLPPVLTGTILSRIARGAVRSNFDKVNRPVHLTRREREVLELIAEGFSNKEVANKLNIATYTVKSHVHNVLEKLALRSRVELAAYAYKAALSIDRSPPAGQSFQEVDPLSTLPSSPRDSRSPRDSGAARPAESGGNFH